eukprot:jgi/Tetstr1/434475/TSEL_023567.t1
MLAIAGAALDIDMDTPHTDEAYTDEDDNGATPHGHASARHPNRAGNEKRDKDQALRRLSRDDHARAGETGAARWPPHAAGAQFPQAVAAAGAEHPCARPASQAERRINPPSEAQLARPSPAYLRLVQRVPTQTCSGGAAATGLVAGSVAGPSL